MYGRGTADMCGGLTAMLLILEEYQEHIPPVTIKFFFTADEETNGTGATALIGNGVFQDVNSLILCEPSDLKLGISEKGTIWLRVTVKGASSHASMPKEGNNALQVGMRFLTEIRQKIEAFSEPHPLLGRNTCEVTGCKSGIKINMIPDEAVFELDIRTLPTIEGGNAAILSMIHEVLEQYQKKDKVKIKIEVLGNREAIEQPEDSDFIHKIKNAVSKDEHCETQGIYFYTDGSIIIPKIKIPFVIFGPGCPKQCHKVDEHISLKQIEQCFYYYKQIIEGYGRNGDESSEHDGR
jgi:succinyl-diaminopimelate desuccinylase